MHRAFTRPIGRARSRAAVPAVLLLVAGLFAGAVAASPSGAAPPSGGVQTTLTVSVSTNNAVLTGAPGDAVPTVLAAKGSATLDVAIQVDGGVELNKGTVITLSAVVDPDPDPTRKPAGSFSPATFTVPSRGSSWTIHEVKYTAQDSDIALLAAVKKTPAIKGQCAFFDIVDRLDFAFAADEDGANDDAELRTGFGATECSATSTTKVCGFVVLPQGITSAAAALSSGCANQSCTGPEEVQFIAGLSDLYVAPKAPATLILRCDKATCKGKGVSSYTAKISLLSSQADAELETPLGFIVSPACTTKGQLNTGYPAGDPRLHFCTDYTSSHRDNAGDLLLEVLFDQDMRGTI